MSVVSFLCMMINIDKENQASGINLATKHEGQHILLIVPCEDLSESQIQANIHAYFAHFDIFALERQPALTTGALRWALEFDEADPVCTVDLMKQGWVQVSSLHNRPQIVGNG